MSSFLRQGASVTASILESVAGALRQFAGSEAASPEEEPAPASAAPQAEPKPKPKSKSKARPASGTRSRISNPKAARKARSREG